MQLNCAFEVTCLVLVNDVKLSQLVQHSSYLWKQCLSSSLIGSVAQCLNSVTSSLVIEAVVSTLRCSLANSLFRRLVICHSYLFVFCFVIFSFSVCRVFAASFYTLISLSNQPLPPDWASPTRGWLRIGHASRSSKSLYPNGLRRCRCSP